jgi:hypothetical protein
MSGKRVPIWLASAGSKWQGAWKKRLGLWVAIVSLFVSVGYSIARIAPFLSDSVLFWLKLFSFVVTAVFGVVGIVSDFKDKNGNLTVLGKLNLAGLVLAAIMGVIVQKIESDNTAKATAEEKKSFEKLLGQNQIVLGQVARNLERVGDTITVSFQVQLLFTGSEFAYVPKSLQQNISRMYRAGRVPDEHTRVLGTLDGKSKSVMFDRKSALIPTDGGSQANLTMAPFVIQFSKTPPQFDARCLPISKPDLTYQWDDRSKGLRSTLPRFLGPGFEDLVLDYEGSEPWITESSEGAVFKLEPGFSSNKLLSGVDFDQAYVEVVSAVLVEFLLERIDIQIGQRHLQVDASKLRPDDKCGHRMYRLPKITD